ncbi:MAG: lipid IV(A) 3-deoxy-D-manno-octulosonic acid transferase [Pseudomonadota bacterium]
MSDLWAQTALNTYRFAGSCLYPFVGGWIFWRARKGKENFARRGERYGIAGFDRPEGPLIWLHAASVGESLAIMPLVQHFEKQGLNLVLTTGTVTSATVTETRLAKSTLHQFVPLDMKPAVNRFLDHWRPDLAVFAESEIWPTTILELSRRRVPQVLVNARMSDRSYKRWSKQSGVANALFEKLALVVAQSQLDGNRLRDLGARRVAVSGNLKFDSPILPVDADQLALRQSQIAGRPSWTAASTHRGEEEIVADVHNRLKQSVPNVLTVLVPRHPERCSSIKQMLEKRGLTVASHQSGAAITPETDIFLGDTIGQMGLFLNLTPIAFVGRSLKAKGGQNPVEPALAGAAILSGANVQNFRAPYEALIQAGGARLVSDGANLADHVLHLMANPHEQAEMVRAARRTVDAMRGSLARTLAAIDPFVSPLQMHIGLERGHTGEPSSSETIISANPAGQAR